MIRVLVIDDVSAIGRAVRTYLRAVADVVPVVHPDEALQLLRAGEQFDVVLCDMELGETTGADFDAVVRAEFPALHPHLGFLSGGAVNREAAAFLDAPGRVTIPKPFEHEELMGGIRRLLGRDW